MRDIQDFERENISMSRPTLDLTPIFSNTTNGKTSPIDSVLVGIKTQFTISPSPIELIPVRKKTTESTPLTWSTELPEKNGTGHVPDDPDPDPSLAVSSSKKKKRDKNKKRRRRKKDDSLDP